MRRAARLLAACLAALPVACAASPPPPCPPGGLPLDGPAGAGRVMVIDHGWHTDLAIPADSLRGPMARFRLLFPGLRVLLVGYGRRSFMMAPVTGLGDLLIGPFPGDGTLLVAGLAAGPDRAYGDGTVATLPLSDDQARRLSAFVWQSFAMRDGQPLRIAPGFFAGSVFYAARATYSGLYTCNSWTEDALHAAGLLPGPAGIVFAGQVMRRASTAASRAGGGLCAIAPHPG